jgi:arylsulfatase A-like enzyme
METDSTGLGARPSPCRTTLSTAGIILLAIGVGLAGGYLDLVLLVLKKLLWSTTGHYDNGQDFPWSIPVAHAVLLIFAAVPVAIVNRIRRGRLSVRDGSWLLVTLAAWFALLRAPLHGAASLVLAAGLGRPLSGAIATALAGRPRRAGLILAGLLGALLLLAALSSGRQAIRERNALAALPPLPQGARNVLVIVWDTVRAYNLGLYGYPRDTTPNLARWARAGVRYARPLAPAPWTLPSHCCYFTGRWPYQLGFHGTNTLDDADPTLAEYLSARGYQTAGFAANPYYCSAETGLARGFAHYEDLPLTAWSLLGRTVPGKWILVNVLYGGNAYAQKWARLQSRDARSLNDAFLDWLRRRRRDRPFFAFLNYFDAHNPYVPPAGHAGRFGIGPKTAKDYEILTTFSMLKGQVAARDIVMARDCYDDCIASLDDQLGRLLAELQGQGLLDQTLVVITADHGEAFGIHGAFGHGESLFLEEVAVPLVILAPGGPAGRVVTEPVSLRDLAATVVEQVGLAHGSPFPGHSLAALWPSAPGRATPALSPAFSEIAYSTGFQPQNHDGPPPQGFQMSLVAQGRHYIRDTRGSEHLFDLVRDPFEMADLAGSADGDRTVGLFRRDLLDLLATNPGAAEEEDAYLKDFRRWLESTVGPEPATGG